MKLILTEVRNVNDKDVLIVEADGEKLGNAVEAPEGVYVHMMVDGVEVRELVPDMRAIAAAIKKARREAEYWCRESERHEAERRAEARS